MNTSSGFYTHFFSGTSGLQLPIPKYLFPQAFENATRLTYYSSFFNSIEINSSFYKIPQFKTITKWSTIVSENFKFTFKLWKGITHNKGLHFNKEEVAVFLQNRPQATIAAPYSLRPKPGATVSMPLYWDKIKKGLKMTDFTFCNGVERIKSMGDIFKPVLGKGINLEKICKTFNKK